MQRYPSCACACACACACRACVCACAYSCATPDIMEKVSMFFVILRPLRVHLESKVDYFLFRIQWNASPCEN